MSRTREFTYKSARSGGLLAGIILVLVSEGVGIHLWVAGRNLWLALFLSGMTLTAIVWLVRDYAALGSGSVRVDEETIHLRIGRRYDFGVPLAAIDEASIPTWRDLPQTGMPAAADYVNLTKQADPNVMLTLASPVQIRIPGGRHRTVKRIALHVDEPQALLDALAPRVTRGQNSHRATTK